MDSLTHIALRNPDLLKEEREQHLQHHKEALRKASVCLTDGALSARVDKSLDLGSIDLHVYVCMPMMARQISRHNKNP
jgi:hypothetical protein